MYRNVPKLAAVIVISVLGQIESYVTITTDIIKNYDRRVRPAKGFNESVLVTFKLSMNQLLEVSEVSQKIQTKLWLYHSWKDPRLAWVPSKYNGIKYVHLPAKSLWLPIFVLYNNADGDFAVTKMTKAKVHYDGTVEWKPPVIFSSFCEIQVANFPFDTQNCTMKIGPWTSGMDLIDMVNSDGKVKDHKCEAPDISDFVTNGGWKLLATGCHKHYIKYDCCAGPYVDMTYHFVIQRRPRYLMLNILLPTMLFGLLTSTVFILPSDAGEKMTLSVSILLSLVVFLLVIVEAIPSTAKGVPLLGSFILFTMILVTFSILITVFVLSYHYRTASTHKMGDWFRQVFMVRLPKMMFCTPIRKVYPFIVKEEGNPSNSFYDDISDMSGREGVAETQLALNPDIRDAIDGVRTLAEHFRDEEESNREQNEWKFSAMVMDHFLGWIFFWACVLGSFFIFAGRIIELYDEEDKFKHNDGQCLLNCGP